jgi:hypothetical protein
MDYGLEKENRAALTHVRHFIARARAFWLSTQHVAMCQFVERSNGEVTPMGSHRGVTFERLARNSTSGSTSLPRKSLSLEYRRLAQEARSNAEHAAHPDLRKVYLRTAELWDQKAAQEESKATRVRVDGLS